MERNRENILLLICRMVEMTMGLVLFILGIALLATTWDGQYLAEVLAILGLGIVIFGSIGLFAIKRHSEDIRDTRLYLLIMYIDFWAVGCCIGAAVCAGIGAGESWGYWAYAWPSLCALAGIGAIVPLIVRTMRLWWSRSLHGMPPEEPTHLKTYASSYYASPSIRPTQDLEAGVPTDSPQHIEAIIARAADEIRSITSSRPWSLAETTNATLYPNIMSAGATVRSQPAPSYTTKPKVVSEANG